MNPFEGQRQLEFRAEQVVWHLVSVGIFGLLLLVLLVSVSLLGDTGVSTRDAGRQIARPVDETQSAPEPSDVSGWVPVGTTVTTCTRPQERRVQASSGDEGERTVMASLHRT